VGEMDNTVTPPRPRYQSLGLKRPFSFAPLAANGSATTGRLGIWSGNGEFDIDRDVDTDGDGIVDSILLDLGYPPIRRGEPLLRGLDPYMSYRRGPFALFALSEYMGAARVNTALRRLVEKYSSGAPPRPTTLDLYRELQTVTPVTLQTSYRSMPAIQHFVNAAFNDDMDGDREALQADYVPLRPHRAEVTEQPAIVALPIAYPYGRNLYGPPQVTQTALNAAQPDAVGAFVAWLLSPECTWTVASGDTRRNIVASDVCLLFRRFVHFQSDITRDYVQALEARGLRHLLVGGQTFPVR